MVDEQQFAMLRHSIHEWNDWRAGDGDAPTGQPNAIATRSSRWGVF
jgi:hypothetical protein